MSGYLEDRAVVRILLAVAAAIVLGGGGLALGFVLFLVTSGFLAFGIGLELTIATLVVLSLLFVQGVGCSGVAIGYVLARPTIAQWITDTFEIEGSGSELTIGAAVPDLRDAAVVVGGYVSAMTGAIVGGLILQALSVDTGRNAAAEIGMENPEVLLLLIPASVLLIGPGEELLFRGVVQGRLREVFAPVPAITLASIIFAGLHWVALTGGSPSGNVAALGVLVIPAFVLGVSYEYTDNIVVPALIHGFYNATLFTLLYVVVAYGDELTPPQTLFV